MANHPNRSRHRSRRNPTPSEIRKLRESAGLSITAAAELVRASRQSWHIWESPERHGSMHPGLWELFQIKVAVLTGRRVNVSIPNYRRKPQ